ncbi:T9SS type A sorting domain-containing protein [Bacteroidota bacterium]
MKYLRNLFFWLFITNCVHVSLSAQFQSFADSYGLLTTIAGKGSMDVDGQPGWLPEYENGNAVDAELTRPHFAMADGAGNIFIADKDAHGIRKVTTDGKIMTVAGTNVPGDNGDGIGTACQLSSPNGLWVKEDGTVYILDLGNNKIRKLDTDGNLTTIVDDDAGIGLGRGIWVTPGEDSIFYASGSKIKLWTEESGIVDYATGFSGLGNITMDKNGFLVATDRSGDQVFRISKDGQSSTLIAGISGGYGGGDGYMATETGFDGVRGVWFLEDNSYFLATHEGSQIWYVATNGRAYLFLDGMNGDGYHSGDGDNYRTPGYKISEARSVSVDYDGNVIITENDLGFIRKIENKYDLFYTSVESDLRSDLHADVYPNPATSATSISIDMDQAELLRMKLYNTVGDEIYSKSMLAEPGLNTLHLDLSEFPGGIYFYKLVSGKSEITEKLIIW